METEQDRPFWVSHPWLLTVSSLSIAIAGLGALAYAVATARGEVLWLPIVLLALILIAVVLLVQRWAHARKALLQRVAELSTIEQVGRAVAEAQLDVDELCALLYQHARELVDTTIFHLGLFDGDRYALQLWMRQGEPEPPRTFQLRPDEGLVSWLRESRQPILIRDLARDIDSLPARPVFISENPPRSALYVPLVAGDAVIGALSVQSFRPNAYAESDLRVLSAMANQAAVAIQKARLLAQERKRARQLEIIGRVSKQIKAVIELDELLRQVVHLIRESFGYYHVAIYTVSGERQMVQFEASASAGQEDVAFEVQWGQGLIGWVAANAQAVIVNDVENDTRYRCVEALDETHSEMAVPLLLQGKPVGVLDVQSDAIDAFGADDLFIVETLADHVAIALHEARLYEAEQQQAWLSTALLQVADSMSRLSDMDAVLTTIVRLVPILAGVERCAILLWDPDAEEFVPAQSHGLDSGLREAFESLSFPAGTMPALDLVRLDRNPLLVDAARDGLLVSRDLAQIFDIHEMLLLPLLAQGELLGTMMVDYAGRPHAFDQRLIDMLTGIANQAAMILHSARLVRAQQEEAYVSMALLQVAEAISRSADLEETLATVARITPMLVGVEACAFLLWDADAGAFRPLQQYGLKGEAEAAFWQWHLRGDDPLVGELRAGKPYAAAQDQLQVGVQMLLPLVTRGDPLGIMGVGYSDPGQRLSERRLSFLAGIASQAAIAIENDRLLREAAEQERMRRELEVAERIQASLLPECCPQLQDWDVAAIWRPAREVGGDFYDFIPLPPAAGTAQERLGVVIADVADKGVPAALFMALSRTLVRTMAIDGRSPASAIVRANDLILADARSDLFVTLFYAILPAGSGEITCANAGHMPPLVVHVADGAMEELRLSGMALGILPGIEIEERTAHLEPGDSLILYTDGVIEASDRERKMFSLERLREEVRAHRACTAAELAEAVDGAVASFVGGAPQFDDFTLVVAKRSERAGPSE